MAALSRRDPPTPGRGRLSARGRSESAGLTRRQPERGHLRRGGDVPGRVVYLFQVQLDGLGEVGERLIDPVALARNAVSGDAGDWQELRFWCASTTTGST